MSSGRVVKVNSRPNTGPNSIPNTFPLMMQVPVPEKEGERFELAIPISEAFAFAMGWSDLNYAYPSDGARRLMGAFALDAMQYSEQWRTAALALACLEERWPGFYLQPA